MPQFLITSPEGKKYRVSAPEGATREQALERVKASATAPQPPKLANEPTVLPPPPPDLTSEPTTSLPRTVLDQSLQGATFGYADEITDRIGAGIASAYTGEKYDDVLKDARSASKQRMDDQITQRPVESIGANLLGGILTGGAGATTKTGTALANSLRSGGTLARAAKGATAGAISGAAYGSGTADEGDRLTGAGEGAAYGAAFGAAFPLAIDAVKGAGKGAANTMRGLFARSIDDLQKTEDAIKNTSRQAYADMRTAGAILNRPRAVSISNKIESAISQNSRLHNKLHGDTMAIVDELKTATRQQDFTLEELDQYRRLLNGVVKKNLVSNPEDANKAREAIDALDDMVDGLTKIDIRGGKTEAIDALNKGRAEWARAKKFEKISDIVAKSDGDANYMKRELKKVLDDPRKHRGFSAEEMEALKVAAKMSTGEAVLKALGKFGFSSARMGNSVGAAVGSGAAYSVGGGGAAIAVPVAGTLARQEQKLLARGKTERLLKTIEGKNSNKSLPQASSGAVIAAPVAGGQLGASPLTPFTPKKKPLKLTVRPNP